VRDAAIYRVSEVGGRTGLRFAYWLTVDRHGLRPRDDKGGGNGILGCELTQGSACLARPFWSKPVPLRLPLPQCPSSFRT
jgi:hypothetical protein